jgi:hypothetical protein
MIRSLLTLLTLMAMALAAVGSTGANFSALQQNNGNRYDAKADWVAPTVTMTDPGTPLQATVSLGATASDSGSGVQSVTIQRSPAGAGTWTTVCTDSGSPYNCSLDTTAGATPDGLYDFRATATDAAGNTATSATVVNRQVDNSPPTGVTMTDPGTNLAGTVTLSGAAVDGSGIASFKFQYRPAAGGLWQDACTAGPAPYSCSFVTTTLGDGLYDFRALATDNAAHATASPVHLSRRVDNVAPTATMNDPGTNLKGTVSLTAAATDGGGIANVVIQRRPNGTSTWTTVCSATVVVYTCSLNTQAGATPDGLYDFQAIATDNANRSTTSSVVLARRIDNTAPSSVTVTNPGATVSGTKSLNGTATDGGSGIQTIALQYSPTGLNTWTTACSGTSSPTNCNFNTATVADGLYDFRTLATDNANNQAPSATTSPATRIDNTAPTVSMVSLAAGVRGTIAPSATASDGTGSGVASVSIEYRSSPAGAWVPLCTDSTPSPYSCSLNTTAGATPDGLYDFRATALDNVSKTTTSAIITTRIDNTAPTAVSLTDPGSPFGGIKTFSGAATDSGSGVATLDIQYLNGSTWVTVCTATTSPFSCQANTATLPIPDGVYSFRSLATDVAGNFTASTAVPTRRVDNTAPTATMTDPGTNLRGTITLAATASDGTGSGVAGVTIQYKTTAGSTWIDVCSDSSSPYSCSYDTAPLAAGNYDFRAVATDNAANAGNSTTITPRRIDNYVRTLASGGCAATIDSVVVPAGGVAVGRTILVRLAMRAAGAGAVSVADSRGNVYTKDADANEGTARIAVFTAPVTTALLAGDTISATHPNNPDSSGIVAAELKNLVAAGRVDVVGTATGNSSNPSASIGTTAASDFLIGATANANNRGMTEASGWDLLSHYAQGCGGSRGNADNHAASRFAPATGPFTYAPTMGQTDHWAEALVAYKTN